MRDPKRIDKVLELLRAYWYTYPDLRLGQIIGNFIPPNSTTRDPYYMEDDELAKYLADALERVSTR